MRALVMLLVISSFGSAAWCEQMSLAAQAAFSAPAKRVEGVEPGAKANVVEAIGGLGAFAAMPKALAEPPPWPRVISTFQGLAKDKPSGAMATMLPGAALLHHAVPAKAALIEIDSAPKINVLTSVTVSEASLLSAPQRKLDAYPSGSGARLPENLELLAPFKPKGNPARGATSD